MARVTVEDCLENVDNRFHLVLVAAKRARKLVRGADPLVDRENDKVTVIALREIADGKVTPDILKEEVQEPDFEVEDETAPTGAIETGSAASPADEGTGE